MERPNKDVYALDGLDVELLRLLQHDGRMPYSHLAKELGVSESTVYSRVNSMMRRGIIVGFTAVVDAEKVGLDLSAFILIQADPKRAESVLFKLKEMDEVVELYDVTGEHYALAKVNVRNRADLSLLLDKIGMLNGVNGTQTLLVLRKHKELRSVNVKDSSHLI
ncbi:MAG: Lrp/AsnC family transcriptional regulator [Thermoprotei archaeon]